MSQWHAREGDAFANAYKVIFHIPIPSATNRASINYRVALVGSGIGGTTVMVEGNGTGQITTAEKTQVLAGELYEHSETVLTNDGENAATMVSKLNARYTALADTNGTFLRDLKRRLEYWGGASAS